MENEIEPLTPGSITDFALPPLDEVESLLMPNQELIAEAAKRMTVTGAIEAYGQLQFEAGQRDAVGFVAAGEAEAKLINLLTKHPNPVAVNRACEHVLRGRGVTMDFFNSVFVSEEAREMGASVEEAQEGGEG